MTHLMKRMQRQTALATGALVLMAGSAMADSVVLDDQIINGSLCVGVDCVNGESFGFDTIRMKENNLRIRAIDTSSSASFPTVDWQLTFNDSANGGLNKFTIDSLDNARTPFTIEYGAATNALVVADNSNIGFGTATPVVNLHTVTGNTPTLRLEQDGSSGFTPQTWDVASNETNFFVRDATNGSNLPFRIMTGASGDAIVIANSGNIGLGTSAPTKDLHIVNVASGTNVELQLEQKAGGATQYRMITSNPNNRRVVGLSAAGVPESQINFGDQKIAFFAGTAMIAELDAAGLKVGGTTLNVPDYVFADNYDLKPLSDVRAYIAENSHLPDVPSAAMIAAGGLNMTEMQMTLLKKVEELTLYTLEQDAKIATLETRLNATSN